MLVSRQHDSEQNPWSKSKYETPLHKPTSSPRMSHHYDTPLSTQSDWQGQQYSYLPPGDNPIYSQSYEHGQAHHGETGSQAQPRSAANASGAMDIDSKSDRNTLSPPLRQRRSEDPSGLPTQRRLSSTAELPLTPRETYAQQATESTNGRSATPADTSAISTGSNPGSSVSSAEQSSDLPGQAHGDDPVKQEDDEDELDDDEMDGEGDGITAEMTPAERTAARRKMKRFRYDLLPQVDVKPPADDAPDLPTNKLVSS